MTNPIETVAPLKRITLALEAGKSGEPRDFVPGTWQMRFIFAMGTQGYTPFEYHLVGKRKGDTVTLSLQPDQITEFFEHLSGLVMGRFRPVEAFSLKATIIDIETPEQREIVREMAAIAEGSEDGCGCGGGGGCGCGTCGE